MLTNSSNYEDSSQRRDSVEARFDRFWQDFNTRLPTEQACFEELVRLLAHNGIRCHYCGSCDTYRSYGQRFCQCNQCRKTSWVMAGTFFARVRSARAWLAAILMMEEGLVFNSSYLHRQAGIAYSSALNIFKKLTTVIHNQMGEETISVHSSLFCAVFGKRSRETPAHQHPIAEQSEMEKRCTAAHTQDASTGFSDNLTGQADSSVDSIHAQALPNTNSANSDVQDPMLPDNEQRVYKALSEKPIHFDSLCAGTGMPVGELSAALLLLELHGLVVRKPGDWYVRQIPQKKNHNSQSGSSQCDFSAKTNIVNETIAFIRQIFHRISRKYLQNYLAAFWCAHDRTRWHPGSILLACLKSNAIEYAELLAYVSPIWVKICQSPNS